MAFFDIPTQTTTFFVTSDNDYLLGETDEITVTPAGGLAIFADMVTNTTLTIEGDLTSSGGTAISYSSGSSGNALSIAATAELQAFGTAVNFWSDPGGINTLSNAGHVQGNQRGIGLIGQTFGTQANTSFDNTGTLIGATDGLHVAGHIATITNSGAIQGDDTGIFLNSASGGSTVANSGTITSLDIGIQIGNFTLTHITNAGGTITADFGILSVQTTEAHITNAAGGEITGITRALRMGSQEDTVINHGTLTGYVEMGSGDDTVTNTGTIDGVLNLGSGTNLLDNSGTITGDVLASSQNDEIQGYGGTVQGSIDTGNGNDSLYVDQADVVIDAGGGFDVVFTRNDLTNFTGVEEVRLKSTGGWEVRASGADDIRIIGNDGSSILVSADGDDTISGQRGADRLSGKDGADDLDGGRGADTVIGGGGNDTILGRNGTDLLKGGNGDDEIRGGGGRDTLEGGAGDDTLSGGGNADVFLYTSAEDAQRDTITDFNTSLDLIDLSGIGAGAFDFLGTSAFSGSAMELRYRVNSAGETLVQLDVDGDGVRDAQITLEGSLALDASMFIL